MRDYAQVRADGHITAAVAAAALARLNVDEFGLDDMDARILTTIIEKFGGGPVGLGTIAAAVGEDAGTLEEVYEPFLIQQGFLERTPRGRCATRARLPALRPHAARRSRRRSLKPERPSAPRLRLRAAAGAHRAGAACGAGGSRLLMVLRAEPAERRGRDRRAS